MGLSLINKLRALMARPLKWPFAASMESLARQQRRRLDLPLQPDRIYAIGDIHGCIDSLRSLMAAIEADCQNFEGSRLLVYLGDYIDRGPDSAAVIEHLLAPPPTDFSRICLCGNHEQVLIDVIDRRVPVADWLQLGGDETLLSYGIDLPYLSRQRGLDDEALAAEIESAVPAAHINFLRQLPVAFSTPEQIFVHAGLRPGVALEDQTEQDLLWIRKPFLTAIGANFGRRVIHGHTTAKAPYADAIRVNIDTGAYLGGPLTAVRLERGASHFLATRRQKPGPVSSRAVFE